TQPDASTLSPAQALDCLRQSGVPLVVWRVAMSGAPIGKKSNVSPKWPEWPEGDWVRGTRDFPKAIRRLREVLDRQRIVWVEDAVDLDAIEPRLPAGVTVAGRSTTEANPVPPPHPAPPPAPGSGLAFVPRAPQRCDSGLAPGLLHRCDGGLTWKPAQTGTPGGIFALAFSGGGATEKLFAGASGALVSSDPASPRWTTFDLPAVM